MKTRFVRWGAAALAIAVCVSCSKGRRRVFLRLPDVSVTQISGATTETGGQATFAVSLDTRPFDDVVVSLQTSDASEGTIDLVTLTFTRDTWNVPQAVTVTGQNDDLADGDQLYAIEFLATASNDQAYDGIVPVEVPVTNIDDETAGITVSAISGPTTESGGQGTFTVVLDSEPFSDVTVNYLSDDTTEGTTDVNSLTFTNVNWAAPQTVTLTGIDDDLADGNLPYAVAFSATTSADSDYAGITPANVLVTNVDDETAGISVSQISGVTTEAGGQATFSVVLNSEPTADVTVNFDSNDTTEGTANVNSLTFTSANWNALQTVTLTGVNDDLADGDQPYEAAFTATTSADPDYAGITPANVLVTNVDDETAGITVSAISGPTTESGGQAAFTVVLNSEPAANVSVNFDSNDTGEGTVSATSLTFTNVNWSAPQTVTLTGVNDDLEDGNQPYAVAFSATTSTDADYAGITPANVLVTNVDDETAGIAVSAASGPTSEAGETATFTVVLNSEPAANVTVNFDSNDTGEGTVGATSLTFTNVNWSAPQTVTLTGVNDDLEDGNQPYAVVFSATTSADSDYAAITPANVLVTNVDDETAGITVSQISGVTTEAGGTATFTVVLNSAPTANVTVNFDSNDTGEGTVSATSLTFTTANWNALQTVTLTGVDDNLEDGPQPYAVAFSATTSTDADYAGITPANVLVTNVDDETAGITVSHISGVTTEAGGTATFTVVLNSEPTANVTVNLNSDDATEGTVSSTALVFTSVNWNIAQTVTVTGVNDALIDGDQPYEIDFSATTSTDTDYSGLIPASIPVTNTDND